MENLVKSEAKLSHGGFDCPRCGGSNLHQRAVTIFSREEDDDVVRRIYVVGDEMVSELTDNDTSGNPSSRRQGLTLHFSCEACSYPDQAEDGSTVYPDVRIMLNIWQHKGGTFIEWRHTP
jgi:hypothetical protein